MKQLCTLLLMLCMATLHAASDPATDKIGTVTGKVIDANLQEPIPFVTVSIQDMEGNIITGGITDDSGTFSISDIPSGKSKVAVQFIGYKLYIQEIELSRKQRKIDLGTISLEEEAASLDEVTIVAETTTIQQKIDRKVINVGKDLTTSGPTAGDIMNNLPSVNVDQQTGALSLRGNQNVRVMVDGKLTNVPVDQLLKQIPSTSIKQIELITNPSAKYNPEGMSGIINIILHKNANLGFNANINAGFTYQDNPKWNTGIDLNYRNGAFNIYGSWGGNYNQNLNFGTVDRPDDGILQAFNFFDDSNSNLYKLGVDYYINEKQTLSFFTNQNTFNGFVNGTTDVTFADSSLNVSQGFDNENDNVSSQYNLDYKIDFEKEGHNIELEVDYNVLAGDEQAGFLFDGNAPQPDYTDRVDTDRSRTTINLDYVNPLSESVKLEAGLEGRLFETEIDYSSTGLSFNSSGELVPTQDTRFDYTRDIYSAYITIAKQWEKFSLQAGVRAETVDVKADTNATAAFTNDYTELYPSVFATYNPSEKNQYQLSYSRRVDRPGIGQVNPIREFSTPLISAFGNTQLRPQFTNSLEANYTRSFEKGSITTGVFYRAISNEINQALLIDRADPELQKLIFTHDNFDDTSAYGLEVSSNLRPTAWWSLNASFDIFSQTQKSFTETLDGTIENPTTNDIANNNFEVDNVVWNARLFNNFKATKSLTFSLFTMYRGANQNVQFDIDPMFMTNIGARYNFWKGKATASVNYNDIFNTMKFQGTGTRPYRQDIEFNWESNTINLALSLRLGGNKYRAKSRKRRDNDEKEGGGIF